MEIMVKVYVIIATVMHGDHSVMHVKLMYYNFVLLEHLGSEQLFESLHSASDNSSPRSGIYMNFFFVTYKFNHL